MICSIRANDLPSITRASVLGRVHVQLSPSQRLDFQSSESQQLLRAAPNGCILSSFPITTLAQSNEMEQACVGWLNRSAETVVLAGAPELVVAVAERLPRSRVFYRLPSEMPLSDALALIASETLGQVVSGFEVSLASQGPQQFVQTCQQLRTAAKRANDEKHGYGHGFDTTLIVVPSAEDAKVLPSSTVGVLDKMGIHILINAPLGLFPATHTTAASTATTGITLEPTSSSTSSTAAATTAATAATTATTAATTTTTTNISNVGLNVISCLRTDRPDGLFATVVCDECGVALGLVYSSGESICESIQTGRGVYYSRSRNGLWRKGATSGAIQELVLISYDCDSDALRFSVRQLGAPPSFCHTGNRSCWGPAKGLRALQQVLQSRLESAPEGSYTRRLYNDEGLLRNKLLEEAQELSEATEMDHVAAEAADVVYFTMVAAVKGGASLEQIEAHLDRRTLKIKRRPGNAKPERIAAAAAELEAIRAAKKE